MTLDELRGQVREFSDARDWGQFHTPRNLALAIGGEVGELMELFQWRTDDEIASFATTDDGRSAIGAELADVLLYLVRLADVLDISLEAAVLKKRSLNELRYPADEVRGIAAKRPPL